ncbi:hypothetical protein J8273_2811 [Carpediemonas membranifera]|uniref:Uncharacterized protein n=1 Tax=Carpediemonas membranifera TaxID=201153 RepID=A0A8J6BZK3_9EUKA|nr:hypothetical protein J8273_2811 [Carpediemonas membranifera]|eukprot:KAG9395616.1 hypothetical protein J8273_2811 [Carpediemonas membranifera]
MQTEPTEHNRAKRRTIQGDIDGRIQEQALIQSNIERVTSLASEMIEMTNDARHGFAELIIDLERTSVVANELEKVVTSCDDIFIGIEAVERGLNLLSSLKGKNQLLSNEAEYLRVIADHTKEAEAERVASHETCETLQAELVEATAKMTRFQQEVEARRKKEKISGKVSLADRLEVAATRLPRVPKMGGSRAKAKTKGQDADLLDVMLPSSSSSKKSSSMTADAEFAALENLLLSEMKRS